MDGDGISLLHKKVDFVATLGGMKLCFGVNTKFAKPSILGKPVGQPLKNQSVVRQPTAFKSERPRISKPRCPPVEDQRLSKNHHYTSILPKEENTAPARLIHQISTKLSRYTPNDIVHNHYLEEAVNKGSSFPCSRPHFGGDC
ncbi:hypothetical protein Tco_1185285 [Tanacetum coccineum]